MPAENDGDEVYHDLADLPSVGPILAKRLYEEITPSSLSDVLEYDRTEGLQSIDGIGPSRRKTIASALENDKIDSPSDSRKDAQPDGRERFLGKLRCPFCPESSIVPRRMSFHCSSCGRRFNEYRNIIDFVDDGTASPGLVQTVMESPLYARVYEEYMRPTLTRFVSQRSMTEEYALSTRYLDLDADSDVLDVGCGTGNFTRHFARHRRALDQNKDGLILGIDLSWPMLNRARRYAKRDGLENRVHFLRGNAERMPLRENSFTHVHCSGTLHLTKNIQATVQNFARVLKPKGTLVVGTFLLGEGYLRPFLKRTGEFFVDFHWFTRSELYDVLSRTGFEPRDESTAGDAITVKAQRI